MGKVAGVPIRLNISFGVEALAQARGHADHRSWQEHLFQLGTGLRQSHDVHGIGAVDTAGSTNSSQTDHLVTNANTCLLLTHLEALTDPQIQKPTLELEIIARVFGQVITQTGELLR